MDVTESIQTRCPGCQAPVEAGDVFCELCGARLAEDPEGTPAGDRDELDCGVAAAVTDRGRIHRRNEDAFGLCVHDERRVAAVVCDGISSASAGDAAARAAAQAAQASLGQALMHPEAIGPDVLAGAIRAAHASVTGVAWTSRIDREAPSCTLVCALYCDDKVIVGSVGDSRAYWLGRGDSRQLTTDDSWAGEQVASGAMSAERAMEDPRAHTITHWIGGDAPERPPEVTSFRPDQPGRRLLCSDGLWNYASTPEALGELVDRLPEGASAAAVARALTDIAVARGGRDNITVAIIDVNPSRRSA
jgi:PPM family protein phosphatase